MARVLLECAPISIGRSSEREMSDTETRDQDDSKVDAIAATIMITIVIVTAVFWLTNQ